MGSVEVAPALRGRRTVNNESKRERHEHAFRESAPSLTDKEQVCLSLSLRQSP